MTGRTVVARAIPKRSSRFGSIIGRDCAGARQSPFRGIVHPAKGTVGGDKPPAFGELVVGAQPAQPGTFKASAPETGSDSKVGRPGAFRDPSSRA